MVKLEPTDVRFHILEYLYYGAFFVDLDYHIRYWNKAAEEITGYSKEEMLGRLCHESCLRRENREGACICQDCCLLTEVVYSRRPRVCQLFLRKKDGRRGEVAAKVIPIIQDDKVTGALELFTDDPVQLQCGEGTTELLKMANADDLTGLPNRRNIEHRIQHKLLRYHQYGERFCTLFVDIDNFKVINDTYGHETGDRVLVTMAELFRGFAPIPTDAIGRWGGEEFVGVYTIQNDEVAMAFANRIHRMLRSAAFHTPSGEPFSVTVSIGVTTVRADDTGLSAINRADQLMYRSKRAGKNCTTADLAASALLGGSGLHG